MHDHDILVIGELNVDLILTGADLVTEFGQAEKLVDDAVLTLGSSSAIFACGASRLGLRVAFTGKVGDDVFGHFMLRTLRERGVDTSPIVVDPEVKTGVTVHFSQPADRAMLTYPGSIFSFSASEVNTSLFSRARHVHSSSFFLQTGLREGLAGLFATAQSAGATVSLDPGWDPAGLWDGTLHRALNHVDVFLPNEQEARRITGMDEVQSALAMLSQKVPSVAVKLGADGAIARQGEDDARCTGFDVRPVDTTGAGDSFNAGFLSAYLQGLGLPECLQWGCACGALSTTGLGGISSQPTLDEMRSLLS